jgi:hypothetical protein
MTSAIRDDMQAEVAAMAQRFAKTFAVDAYPRVADGPAFDRRVGEFEAALAILKQHFNDYLMSVWADEMDATIQAVRKTRATNDR